MISLFHNPVQPEATNQMQRKMTKKYLIFQNSAKIGCLD